MSGGLLIEISTFLLVCAIVVPIVRMSYAVRGGRSAHLTHGYRVIQQAMLIAIILGMPGMILEILAALDRTQPGPGWIFIILGAFFLACTFIVPVFWGKLTNKLSGPSAELEGIAGCTYTLLIAITLGLLSIVLLILGIILEITGG